ncbi:MAG: hypothetical protein J3K34DRAFT_417354, partial [Monoraphidium minutum]
MHAPLCALSRACCNTHAPQKKRGTPRARRPSTCHGPCPREPRLPRPCARARRPALFVGASSLPGLLARRPHARRPALAPSPPALCAHAAARRLSSPHFAFVRWRVFLTLGGPCHPRPRRSCGCAARSRGPYTANPGPPPQACRMSKAFRTKGSRHLEHAAKLATNPRRSHRCGGHGAVLQPSATPRPLLITEPVFAHRWWCGACATRSHQRRQRVLLARGGCRRSPHRRAPFGGRAALFGRPSATTRSKARLR